MKKVMIVLIILVIGLVVLFSPELKGYYYSYQTKTELNKIVSDTTDIVCDNSLCTVEVGSKGGRFRFIFSDIDELSAKVSLLNKGLLTWPTDDSFCLNQINDNGSNWCVL